MCKESEKLGKTDWSRVGAGILYLLLGVVFFSLYLKLDWIQWAAVLFSRPFIQWCAGWTCFGIGVGLINTRNHPKPPCWPLHYLGYYGFVLLVVSITALVAGLYGSKETWESLDNIKSRSLAALVGLIGGFLGYKLHDLLQSPFKMGGDAK